MRPLSVVVITENEAAKIRRCLESVAPWADEIVVVDSFSTDGTPEICREYTPRVIQREYRYSADQYTFAIAQAKNEWVMLLDADEEVTPELVEEMQREVVPSSPMRGFRVNRRLIVNGRWIRFGGQYPDAQLRIFPRDEIVYEDKRVHAPNHVAGPVKDLRHDLLHYSYDSLSHIIQKVNVQSTKYALDLADRGRKPGWPYLLVRLVQEFVWRLVFRGGFRDGVWGLILAASHAYYVFALYAKAWELAQKPK